MAIRLKGNKYMSDNLVDKVKGAMPQEEDLIEVAELFKAFGDLTRAKIICALSQSELCVGDIALLLEMNQSAVSHQLRLLKQARLVKTRRDGKVRYYSLADEHIQEMFKVAFEHVMEE
ncbi:MAG: transcriptional regulator [Clostridia bacterium]|nr:transcriptional regulator [Clostridia bacterium]NCD03910.1 transcriptional regulator [Clostridia bacterium]